MLLGDLLQVLGPVVVETKFLFSEVVKLSNDSFHALFEPGLERCVVFIPGFDDMLVVFCVLDVDVVAEFISGTACALNWI